MEMAQIRYVLAAAEHLNFTRAAAACNVTQPALTKGIKALEAQLGTPVFHREGKRILISEFGRAMLPHLQHIADEAEATQVLARNFRLMKKAPLRLGVMATIGHVRLARFLRQLEREHAGLEISVSEGLVPDLTQRLDQGDLDFAVVEAGQVGEQALRFQDLYRERYVVVFPPDHALGARDAVRLADLSGEPYVDRLACEMREMVTAVCQDRGIELYARFRSEREDWVQAMVLAGIGFAFMPEFSVTLPGLLQRPLVDPAVERQVVLAGTRGRRHTPAMETFLRAAGRFAWPG